MESKIFDGEFVMYYYDDKMRLMTWYSPSEVCYESLYFSMKQLRRARQGHTIFYDEGWD